MEQQTIDLEKDLEFSELDFSGAYSWNPKAVRVPHYNDLKKRSKKVIDKIKEEKKIIKNMAKEEARLNSYLDDYDIRKSQHDMLVESNASEKDIAISRTQLEKDKEEYEQAKAEMSRIAAEKKVHEEKLEKISDKIKFVNSEKSIKSYNIGKNRRIKLKDISFGSIKKRFVNYITKKVADKLIEYGYGNQFANAVDTAVAQRNPDTYFAENANNLTQDNEKIVEERNKIQEALDFAEKNLDKVSLNNATKEETPVVNYDKKIEDKVNEALSNMTSNQTLAIEQKDLPLGLPDNIIQNKADDKKIEDNNEVKADYSNDSLDSLLSQYQQLTNDINRQVRNNSVTQRAYENQEKTNDQARLENLELAKEKEQQEKELFEFVRKAVDKKQKLYNSVKEEGKSLEDKLSSARETGEQIDNDRYQRQAEIASIKAHREQIAEMLNESNMVNNQVVDNVITK